MVYRMSFSQKRRGLGLALGSGGAKGAAHIGALKAFEENNITFDYVAGTSIGSVVGALYAKGYSADDMANLVKETGLSDPKRFLFVAAGVRSLGEGLSRIFGGAEFCDLKKPFCAVATNLDNGEEVDISDGDIASAVAASCSIQPVFGAVTRNGVRLIDGAFVNSVPANVVKRLGADKVVSINLGKGKDDNYEIKRILDEVYPENGVEYRVRSKACYENSAVIIEPELERFSSASIGKFDAMYVAGYESAKAKIDEIKKLYNER